MSEAEEPSYGLVMPYVCCKTNGGEYDDGSFVAGAQMENVRWELKAKPPIYSAYVASPLTAQLDLIAMDAGYVAEFEAWDEHPDEWTLATFRLIESGG